MPTVAYLANLFPSPVEPYVVAEVHELRRRGVGVLPCSARLAKTELDEELKSFVSETVYLERFQWRLLLRAAWLCVRKFPRVQNLLHRALVRGKEPPTRRLRALIHTWLGAYFALLLEGRRIDHIHAHHGYFGSWIAMTAARLLGVGFSMTLHGSDLLLHPAYLDLKLKHCRFCVTVSEFNRQYILEHYPEVLPEKIHVQYLGVDCPSGGRAVVQAKNDSSLLVMLAVGRLHAVKDHAFLVRACHQLKRCSPNFLCLVAGEGPERGALEKLICDLNLQDNVRLLGHVPHARLNGYFEMADLIVLTSRSEGIPLALMEAMARERIVLAPAITGVPELVVDGETGFLYRPGSLEEFVERVRLVQRLGPAFGPLRRAAREHVLQHFSRGKNLAAFCDLLITSLNVPPGPHSSSERLAESSIYENPVLQ
ncbi:MAG: glycosyltransferase family 4 protein [Acidobacteriia bacterium]|nr:glycosyltransferase family 4 protein [Terriglobia bacterium]